MHPYEINPLVLDNGFPLSRIGKQFSHGKGHGCLLSQILIIPHLVRGQRVLQEKQFKGLQLLCKSKGICQRKPLMNIVHDLKLPSKILSYLLKQPDYTVHIHFRMEIRAFRRSLRLYHLLALAIEVPAVGSHVTADVPVSFLNILTDTLLYIFQASSVRMAVNRHTFPGFSAKQAVKRHAGQLSLDVPQGLIHSRYGIIEDWAIAPIGASHHGLPDILYIMYAPAL